MKSLKWLIASLFLCLSVYSAHAQLFTANVNATFSSPAHDWELSTVEYYADSVKCYFKVKSTAAKVYLRLLPGCYLIDNAGNKYELLESNLTSEAPGVKFSVVGEPLYFYMKFPAMKPNVNKMSLVLPELKVIEDIPVGDGRVIRYNLGEGVKAPGKALWITNVVISDTETAVTFLYSNVREDGFWPYWDRAGVDKDSKLVVGGVSYPLLPGQKKSWSFDRVVKFSFTLNFAPIPKDAKRLDFIETPTSNWNIKGVLLKTL